MFDIVEVFLTQLIGIMPYLIPLILVMNLVCSMLFDKR